ncbi:hypothetical protein N431DRAFT_444781 [Stipitochalara longipes BDJ]|nr:hypothetical protein N431DRAFT_444781 [Stipitochalara longipes BDJ]
MGWGLAGLLRKQCATYILTLKHNSSSDFIKTPLLSEMARQLTWLITGTSSGLGEALARKALARGDWVIATARNLSKSKHLKQTGAEILELDVTASRVVIDAKARDAIAIVGTVDAVLNNAGSVALGSD